MAATWLTLLAEQGFRRDTRNCRFGLKWPLGPDGPPSYPFLGMRLSDLPEVRAHSAREKLQLIDELLVQLARDIDALDTTGEEKRLLEDRWNRYLTNPSSALDLEGFRKRLDALRA